MKILLRTKFYSKIIYPLLGLDKIVKLLIEKGADVDAEELYGGMTALMWALRRGTE